MSSFSLSNHATFRASQRNINKDALDIVLIYGVDVPAGVSVSKRSLRTAHLQEIYQDDVPINVIEQALNLEVVVANDGVVITCYKNRKLSFGQRSYRNVRKPKNKPFRKGWISGN